MSDEWQNRLVTGFTRHLAGRFDPTMAAKLVADDVPVAEISLRDRYDPTRIDYYTALREDLQLLASVANRMTYAFSQSLGNAVVTQLDFKTYQDSAVLILAARLLKIAQDNGFDNFYETVHPHVHKGLWQLTMKP